ncbi:MAG: ATP-dependent 6-phosphofructokinase [Ilumatobacteraceae bacterium]
MRVGVLTGGGDCPGLNAVIRAIVRKGERHYGDEIIGFLDAWDGVLNRRYMPLDVRSLRGMLPKGGTLLGTRRGSPYDYDDGIARVREALAELSLDALIVIGGNGSLTVASRLHSEGGIPVIGVPKTIDNDIVGTDVTFGFHTAVQIATDAIDRLHTTAESHDRVMVVEVMGRHAGWIATYAGIAGGATDILVPERPFDLDEVAHTILRRHERGRWASIIVVAEGAEPKANSIELPDQGFDSSGHKRLGGIASFIAPELEKRTGFEARVVQIGHVQRGGTPTAYDRVLSTRYGLAAIDAVHEEAWGDMVVLRSTKIQRAPMTETVGLTRTLDMSLYRGRRRGVLRLIRPQVRSAWAAAAAGSDRRAGPTDCAPGNRTASTRSP